MPVGQGSRCYLCVVALPDFALGFRNSWFSSFTTRAVSVWGLSSTKLEEYRFLNHLDLANLPVLANRYRCKYSIAFYQGNIQIPHLELPEALVNEDVCTQTSLWASIPYSLLLQEDDVALKCFCLGDPLSSVLPREYQGVIVSQESLRVSGNAAPKKHSGDPWGKRCCDYARYLQGYFYFHAHYRLLVTVWYHLIQYCYSSPVFLYGKPGSFLKPLCSRSWCRALHRQEGAQPLQTKFHCWWVVLIWLCFHLSYVILLSPLKKSQ